MAVAAGFEPRFSWAAVASLIAGVRGARVSWAHLRCVWLFATCFQRAGSGLAATSHLKEGNLFFFAVATSSRCWIKQCRKDVNRLSDRYQEGQHPRAGRSAGLGRNSNLQSGVGCNFSRSATGSSESLCEPWGYAGLGVDLDEKCTGHRTRKDCRAGGL